MANIKKTVLITDLESKESKAGNKFWTAKTNEGYMNFFENSVYQVLKKKLDEKVVCEVAEVEKDGKVFKNIRNVFPDEEPQEIADSISIKEETVKDTPRPKIDYDLTAKRIKTAVMSKVCASLMVGGMDNNEAIDTTYRIFEEFE